MPGEFLYRGHSTKYPLGSIKEIFHCSLVLYSLKISPHVGDCCKQFLLCLQMWGILLGINSYASLVQNNPTQSSILCLTHRSQIRLHKVDKARRGHFPFPFHSILCILFWSLAASLTPKIKNTHMYVRHQEATKNKRKKSNKLQNKLI